MAPSEKDSHRPAQDALISGNPALAIREHPEWRGTIARAQEPGPAGEENPNAPLRKKRRCATEREPLRRDLNYFPSPCLMPAASRIFS